MSYVDRLVPALTIIVTTIFVALPWGMSAENRFLLPLLPLIVIHYWTVRRPDVIAEWWAFGAGLCIDVLTHGPMGYWALIYLMAFAAAKFSTVFADSGRAMQWLLASLTLFALTGFGWAVSSLYYFEIADWRPYVTAAVAASIIYPIVGVILRGLSSSRNQTGNVLLERGA